MRIMRFIGLCLFVICGGSPCFAASAGVVVRVWQSQEGLPSNVVRSVVQSSDGYLWVATAEGIACFDGFDFDLIEQTDDLTKNRLAFARLFATAGGGVWAGTYQGGLFRVRNGVLEKILDDKPRPNPPLVTQVVEDGVGAVVFKRGGSYGKILRNGGVETVPPSAHLERLFEIDAQRRAQSGRIMDNPANPVLRDQAGRVWTADASGGLTVTENGGSALAVEFPQRGKAFGVNEMLLDREGNVWVASPVNGLARIRTARVEIPDLEGNQGRAAFSALIQTRSGDWWIADRKRGLIHWANGEARRMEFSIRPAATFFEDRDSVLWVASRGGTVYQENNGQFVPQFYKSQIPSKVRSITQDAAGTLWFGGSLGLASLADGKVHQWGRSEGVGDLDVTVVQPFPGNRIIAGSTAGHVLLGGVRGFATIGEPQVFNHQWISGVLPLAENEIWVSTLGSGLFLWNGRKWQGFGANDGVPDMRLTCVLDDGRGSLWMGSLQGIIRVDRKELLARSGDPETPVHWLLLDHTDGLPSRECIGGFQPAGWRAQDGYMWFPTSGGLVRVRPDLVARNKIPPPVYLQSVRANGIAHLGDSGPVITDPGRARLEFRYVGLCYSAPEKTTYRARLKGLDDTWRELGTQRIAAFEAVPPGRYTFEVMAVNGEGVRSPETARVAVIVRPHLWETMWFYFAAALLVVSVATGIGWLAARWRMKARIQVLKIRNAREAERSRIARDLHDDLGASLTEISILAALAAEDAEKTPLQPSLDQLSTKAKHVVGSLDEIVWAVNPREDSLLSLVEYITAFAREFLDIARIPLRVDIPSTIPEHPLPASRRHGVFLAAREALNNIVKHSAATEVNLHVAIADDLLEIRVSDNGRGFESDYAITGEGLGNLRSRMQEVGGDCRIETHRGLGTTVCLTLPLHLSAKPLS